MGRRLRASPASAGELALAIAVGPFQVLAVQSAILVAVGGLAFGVRWGSPAGMLLVTGGLPDEVAAFGRIFPPAWALDAYLALLRLRRRL